jgi:hypothetical protein
MLLRAVLIYALMVLCGLRIFVFGLICSSIACAKMFSS